LATTLNIADGSLCFDFANTLDARRAARTQESLNRYADLVNWASKVGIVQPDQASDLLAKADANPSAAEHVLRQVIDLREAIYRAFDAIANDQPPVSADLDLIRDAYARAVSIARIRAADSGFTWNWGASGSLDWPLAPVARDAIELLLSDELGRVKTCNADACGWVFLDTSKNGSRRWCSMDTCGSRMKMRRHYARKKASRSGE
jgi:predicted RNA-binding Zn ribbon-like protein